MITFFKKLFKIIFTKRLYHITTETSNIDYWIEISEIEINNPNKIIISVP
jgi:hypothetical protein